MPELTPAYQGWLTLKQRSLFNIRPKNIRYCVLYVNGLFCIYRFQPTNDIPPLKEYLIDGIINSTKEKQFFFLLSVSAVEDTQQKQLLEVYLLSKEEEERWREVFTLYQSPKEDGNEKATKKNVYPGEKVSAEPNHSKKIETSHLLRVGASIHRGIENRQGENNCFLNVIIQSIWHLVTFRKAILCVDVMDTAEKDANVIIVLQKIMRAYEETPSGCIDPIELRKELDSFYKSEKLFAEGCMTDAEEAMLALLDVLHKQTAYLKLSNPERDALYHERYRNSFDAAHYIELRDEVFNPQSITHAVFSHQIYDRFVCLKCNRKMEWELLSNLIFNVFASEFINAKCSEIEPLIFSLPSKLSKSTKYKCEDCKSIMHIDREIRHLPMVFVISLMWEATDVASGGIVTILNTIGNRRLELTQAFRFSDVINRTDETNTLYRLRGFVCYYGCHYFSFFYSTVHKAWLLFDDKQVKQVGNWSDVIARCSKGKCLPVLLFYETPDSRKDSSVGLFSTPSSNPMRKDSRESPLSRLTSIDENNATPTNEEELFPARTTTASIPTPAAVYLDEKSLTEKYQHIVHPSLAMIPREKAMQTPCNPDEYDVQFGENVVILGLYLEKINDGLCVTRFSRGPNNEIFGAEESKRIGLYDRLIQANGYSLQKCSVERAMDLVKAQSRPLVIRFQRSPEVAQLCAMGFPREICQDAICRANGNVEVAANLCFEISKR